VNELAAAYLEKQSTGMQAAGSSQAGQQESLKAPTSLDRPQCSWQRQVSNFDMPVLLYLTLFDMVLEKMKMISSHKPMLSV